MFEKHAALFQSLGVDPDNGIGDVYAKIQRLPPAQRAAIEADIQAVYATRPALAMVDSSKGITNLHVPSDVIIDASMPAAIRASGQMWGPDGKLHDTKAMIPDRCVCRASTRRSSTTAGRTARSTSDDGHRLQRRADGAEGGGVRLARQDVRDRRATAPCAWWTRGGTDALRAPRRGRRHLADVPDEGPADPRLGQAGGEPRRGDRPCGDLLAGSTARLRPQRDRKDAAVPEGSRHVRARHPDPVAGRGDARRPSSACAPGSTRFR